MRIGVNAINIESGFTSEGAYLRHALVAIRKAQPEIHFVLFTEPENHDSFAGWERILVGKSDEVPGGERSIERAARRAAIDRLLSPLRTAPAKSPVRLVLYVLDAHFLDDLAGAASGRAYSRQVKELRHICSAAAGLVAPSEAIRKRLLDVVGIPIDRVVVAPPGVDEAFDRPSECFVERPYLLTVCDTHPCANLPCLLDAYNRINEESPHNLIIVGCAGEAEPDDWGPGILRIDECPASQLAGLYHHCDVFVCPSLHEGVTLSILEAMRAGARVVAARVGGIPEVASSAPIYFNPDSAASLASSIRRALNETPEERARHIKFGQQRAAQFTWEQCAWKMLLAFRRGAD